MAASPQRQPLWLTITHHYFVPDGKGKFEHRGSTFKGSGGKGTVEVPETLPYEMKKATSRKSCRHWRGALNEYLRVEQHSRLDGRAGLWGT